MSAYLTKYNKAVIITRMNTMSNLKYDAVLAINAVPPLPTQIPYGHIYTATIVSGGVAFSETFKYNPATFDAEGMDDIIKKLLLKAGIISDKVNTAEIEYCTLDFLLDSEGTPLPTTITRDHNILRIKLSGVRWRVPSKRAGSWLYGDSDSVIVVTPVQEWECEAVDKINASMLQEWHTRMRTALDTAITKLTAMRDNLQTNE